VIPVDLWMLLALVLFLVAGVLSGLQRAVVMALVAFGLASMVIAAATDAAKLFG
jgi:hypothetical protein